MSAIYKVFELCAIGYDLWHLIEEHLYRMNWLDRLPIQ